MRVEVGQIVNTHGIKGEIKVKSNSDFTDVRFQPGQVLTVVHNNNDLEYTVKSHRVHKGLHMLTFEGINNINDIEHLKGSSIYQERDHEDIVLEENEFYYSDIIGCTVFDDQETPIGRVINIFETGANDVWVIKGSKEYLIPYIADVVKEVDVENKKLSSRQWKDCWINENWLFNFISWNVWWCFKSFNYERAQENNKLQINTVNFRDYAINKHKQVDDYPYGGGQGMVLKPEPVFNAMEDLDVTEQTRVILMCPQGEPFSHQKAVELSKADHIVFICGHYEGYDERIRTHLVTDEISMGDYVLTGGELPAMTMTDAIVRLIPGVLGNEQSHQDDSFSDGLLEFPQYTRPREFKGLTVPDVLLSGNHANIDAWRHEQKLIRTYNKRPDLIEKYPLTNADKQILERYKIGLKKG